MHDITDIAEWMPLTQNGQKRKGKRNNCPFSRSVFDFLAEGRSRSLEEVTDHLFGGEDRRFRSTHYKLTREVLRKLCRRTRVGYNHVTARWFWVPDQDDVTKRRRVDA